MSDKSPSANFLLDASNSIIDESRNYHTRYQLYLNLVETYKALIDQNTPVTSIIELHEEMILNCLPNFFEFQELYCSKIEAHKNSLHDKKLLDNKKIESLAEQLTNNVVSDEPDQNQDDAAKIVDSVATAESLSSISPAESMSKESKSLTKSQFVEENNKKTNTSETKKQRLPDLLSQKEGKKNKAVEEAVGNDTCSKKDQNQKCVVTLNAETSSSKQEKKSDGNSNSTANKKKKKSKTKGKAAKKDQKTANEDDDEVLNEAYNKAMEEEDNYRKAKRERVFTRHRELMENFTEETFRQTSDDFSNYVKDRRQSYICDNLNEKIENLLKFHISTWLAINRVLYLESFHRNHNYEQIEREMLPLMMLNKDAPVDEKIKKNIKLLDDKVFLFQKDCFLNLYEKFSLAQTFVIMRIDTLKLVNGGKSTPLDCMNFLNAEFNRMIKNNILCHLLFTFDTNLTLRRREFEATDFFGF